MTVKAASAMLEYALEVFSEDWSDPEVQDIFVVGPGHYFVRRSSGTERREAPDLDDVSIGAIAAFAGHLRGQYADEDSPILDCELPNNDRLNIMLPPVVPDGKPAMSLRRQSEDDPNLEELAAQGLWKALEGKQREQDSTDLHAERINLAKSMIAAGQVNRFLRNAVAWRWSIAIVGETGSGKTHNITAIINEIPINERIITVGNVEELKRLPHPNRLSLLYSADGPVTAEALIEASLRSAPRWLVVQEIRGREAFAFLRALASGHPGITTWHARSAERAFDPLETMVRQHPAMATMPRDALRGMMRSFVDVVMHVERTQAGEFRATDIKFGREID